MKIRIDIDLSGGNIVEVPDWVNTETDLELFVDEYVNKNISANYEIIEQKSKDKPICKFSVNGYCTNLSVACKKCNGGESEIGGCYPFQMSIIRTGESWRRNPI